MKDRWLGRTLGVGLAAALGLVVVNYICPNIEAKILERQAYRIANTDNNQYLDLDEASQLGRDLGLIAKDDILSFREIEDIVNNTKPTKNIEMFQKYIDSHKGK